MDNATRSERSRNALLEAALTIIARDGPARLTLDAISRESGISKGGLLHQFRTKEAVLQALVDRQVKYFEDFSRGYMAEFGDTQPQPNLAAKIATLREAMTTPASVVFAVLGAATEVPSLLSTSREIDAGMIEIVKDEASDAELSLLRWSAAWGLTLTSMLGVFPLSEEMRERLFDRLLDEKQWPTVSTPQKS